MPTDREAPQCPRCSASDPGPILLPCLVGQTWMHSPPSHSIPRAEPTHSTTTPGKATPPSFLPAFTQTKRDTMPFFVWDGRSVINLGAWVFFLHVKTCWGEGRLANSQERSQSTRGAKLMKSLPLTSVAHWLLTQPELLMDDCKANCGHHIYICFTSKLTGR